MRSGMFVAVVLAIALFFVSVAAVATKTRGTFQTLPAGTELGLQIEGVAQLTRADDATFAKVDVRGLEPGATYAAHPPQRTVLRRQPRRGALQERSRRSGDAA